jgi:hypothetical protein
VLTFPLPAFAGGGSASIGVKASPEPGHVTLVVTSLVLNGTVTVPAFEALAFAEHVAQLARRAGPNEWDAVL